MVSANEQVRQRTAANITTRLVFSITCLLFLGWFLAVVTMMNECRTNLQACNLEICSEAASTSEKRRHTVAGVQCLKFSQTILKLIKIPILSKFEETLQNYPNCWFTKSNLGSEMDCLDLGHCIIMPHWRLSSLPKNKDGREVIMHWKGFSRWQYQKTLVKKECGRSTTIFLEDPLFSRNYYG